MPPFKVYKPEGTVHEIGYGSEDGDFTVKARLLDWGRRADDNGPAESPEIEIDEILDVDGEKIPDDVFDVMAGKLLDDSEFISDVVSAEREHQHGEYENEGEHRMNLERGASLKTAEIDEKYTVAPMPAVEELREQAVAYGIAITSIDAVNGTIVVPEGYGAPLQEMITKEYPNSNITKYEIKCSYIFYHSK